MKILSVDQLYELDKITINRQNLAPSELMERAGKMVFDWITGHFEPDNLLFHIFCGVGNNGGDGLVVGRLLHKSGYRVKIYIVQFSDSPSTEFVSNYQNLQKENVESICIGVERNFPEIGKGDIIIDAIFGIGLNRSTNGWIKQLIDHLNKSGAYVLSLDIPSGLFANTPINDNAAVIKADYTLTFQLPKMAFVLPDTASFVSRFECLDIGLDTDYIEKVQPLATLVSKADIQEIYRPRNRFGYKGTYGHCLIVGGSHGKIGAAVLSTKSAFRIGAGMVTTFVPKCGYQILQTAVPEAMTITDKEQDFITEITLDFKPSAIGIGIGMGKNRATVKAMKELFIQYKGPFVIDADALNNLSENQDLLTLLPAHSILTPHIGELRRLIGTWKDDYEKLEKTKRFSKRYNVTVIIKGPDTLTVYKDQVYVNTTGNPGMGTAGSGDVLTGIITGLRSQGYDMLAAAIFGVYIHGLAGDLAAKELGLESLMAGDILQQLGEAYNYISPER